MVPGTMLQVVPVASDSLDSKKAVICIVHDETSVEWKASNNKFHINLPRSTTVQDLYAETGKEFSYEQDSFLLVWKPSTGCGNSEDVELKDDLQSMRLDEIGLPPEKKKQCFFLRCKNGENPVSTKPKAQEQVGPSENADGGPLDDGSVNNLFEIGSSPYYGPYAANSSTSSAYGEVSTSKSETGFVGLVNQAMTCYLNSLLQTLFMTPEFRNAIYKWKFIGNTADAEKSIPYQLQRLFVHMQFSNKRAVETTDVTKSFGWDSSDAWHQHDVQELCRVMFDALETVFKNTDQAHLINQLYQGKMKDYVKCLECGHESARSDTFLDIPLVIRPFGIDNYPHGSVEEALDAFVKAERLEGNNQYKCDKCEKLCDADKGLKFCSFPHLLTLQLKRFAFDFNLLHRVKLNDRMTFPKYLNLNKYIMMDEEDSISQSDSHSSIETDSGVSLGGGSDNGVAMDDVELNDVAMDGVDKQAEACCLDFHDSDEMQAMKGPRGPYIYELFSIMIHSGSAIGGHYYAYIKSFADNQWYSFNDQTVTKITNNDIKRTFGGTDNSKGYYSSHYSSSANAYMLMYRQIKPDKCGFMAKDELPDHAKDLVTSMHDEEKREQELKHFQKSICRIKLFCRHPVTNEFLDVKFEIHKDKTLKEATEQARQHFGLKDTVSLENCRIVKYDEYNQTTEVSYEGKEEEEMNTILDGVQQTYLFDLLLETKRDDEEFPVYLPGGISVKVYEVNIEEQSVAPPVNLRLMWMDKVSTLYETVRKKLNTLCKHIIMMWERYSGDFTELKPSKSRTLKDENFFKQNKVYVLFSDEEPETLPKDMFLKILDDFSNSICLNITLPKDVYAAEQNNVFQMNIHKRVSLGDFKEKLESHMGCSSEMFKVFRLYSNNQELEMDRLTDTFASVPDQSKIIVKHGRALKQDEFRSKVFLFKKNETEHAQFLLETILCKVMTVLETKKNLHQQLVQDKKANIPVERMRLRKKSWKSPGKILKNDQKCDHIVICGQTTELFVEELDGAEPVQNDNQLSIYLRRWRRSTYTFDPLQEVVVDNECSVTDFKTKISECSDIPEENIEIAKARGTFPYDVSVLEADDDLEWNPKAESLKYYPIMINNDGALFFYRDKTESLMELTEEKRNEIKKAENAKSAATTSARAPYKPREKALKIYTDR